MTLYHFGNCVALLTPYYFTYKYSGLWVYFWLLVICRLPSPQLYQVNKKLFVNFPGLLFNHRSEYGAFWKCVQAGGIYIFTQLVKMLVLATFFYSDAPSSSGEFNFFAVRVLIFVYLQPIIEVMLWFLWSAGDSSLQHGHRRSAWIRPNLESHTRQGPLKAHYSWTWM